MNNKKRDKQTLAAFNKMLAETHVEEDYQSFLEANPRFIPREFVQNHGIHCSLIFKKLRLAENYITDFFYISKSSADWNIVFIEIEKPHSQYFKNGTDDFHKDFLTGLAQMNRWRAWAGELSNIQHLLNETLEPVWQPPIMRSNPVYPKYILITGRRDEFLGDKRRLRLIQSQEREDFKILSYDSLIEGSEYNHDAYVASRTNSHIIIHSNSFVSEAPFAAVDPRRLVISKELYDDAFANRDSWVNVFSLNKFTLDKNLPQVTIS